MVTNYKREVIDMEVIKLKVPDVVTAIGVLETSLKREMFLLDKSIRDTKKKLSYFIGITIPHQSPKNIYVLLSKF